MIQVTLDHPAVASSSSLEKFLSVEPTTPQPLLEIQTHSELKCQIRLGNYSWGYNAQIFHFCLPLDFLGAKDFKKIIKGRRRSERPNQRPDTGEFKF